MSIDYAIEFGQIKIVQILMSLLKENITANELFKLPLWRDTSPAAKDPENRHLGILSYAAMLGNEQITVFLLEYILKSNIDYLIKHSPAWNDAPFDLLHIAAGKGNDTLLIAIIETLKKWERGQEVLAKLFRQTTYDKKSLFTCAALFGHSKILDILFETDPISAKQALSNVIVSMDEFRYGSLDEKYCPSDFVQFKNPPPYPFNYQEVFRMLIERGADINAPDPNNLGKTALHCAIERCASTSSHKKKNDLELINFLFENGADINAKDNQGETPLYYFVRMTRSNSGFFLDESNDAFKILKRLLDANPDLNTTNNQGETVIAFIQRPVFFGLRAGVGGNAQKQVEQVKEKVIELISKRLSSASQSMHSDEIPSTQVGASEFGLFGEKGKEKKQHIPKPVAHPYRSGPTSCSIS